MTIKVKEIEYSDKENVYALIEVVNKEDRLGYSLEEDWLDYIIDRASEGVFLAYGESTLLGMASCMVNT